MLGKSRPVFKIDLDSAKLSMFLKKKKTDKMECGVLGPEMQSGNSKTNLRVNFKDKVETKERREKYLTAKYGSHQMTLIRKRLAVEMWLYEELQKLFEVYN